MAEADPGDLSRLGEIALYLLPRWFGTSEGFGDALREAAFATNQELGLAGYATGFLSVFKEEPCSFLWIDPDLLEIGIADYAALRRADQAEVARLYLALYDLTHGKPPLTVRGADRDEWRARQFRLAKTARAVLAHHLTAIVPAAWGGEAVARRHLAEAYQKDLRNGARVRVDREGITVIAG